MCVCVCVCVCACVRACVRACVCARVRVCVVRRACVKQLTVDITHTVSAGSGIVECAHIHTYNNKPSSDFLSALNIYIHTKYSIPDQTIDRREHTELSVQTAVLPA